MPPFNCFYYLSNFVSYRPSLKIASWVLGFDNQEVWQHGGVPDHSETVNGNISNIAIRILHSYVQQMRYRCGVSDASKYPTTRTANISVGVL